MPSSLPKTRTGRTCYSDSRAATWIPIAATAARRTQAQKISSYFRRVPANIWPETAARRTQAQKVSPYFRRVPANFWPEHICCLLHHPNVPVHNGTHGKITDDCVLIECQFFASYVSVGNTTIASGIPMTDRKLLIGLTLTARWFRTFDVRSMKKN